MDENSSLKSKSSLLILKKKKKKKPKRIERTAVYTLEASFSKDGVAIVHDVSANRFLRVERRIDGGGMTAMSANHLLLLLDEVRF